MTVIVPTAPSSWGGVRVGELVYNPGSAMYGLCGLGKVSSSFFSLSFLYEFSIGKSIMLLELNEMT